MTRDEAITRALVSLGKPQPHHVRAYSQSLSGQNPHAVVVEAPTPLGSVADDAQQAA